MDESRGRGTGPRNGPKLFISRYSGNLVLISGELFDCP